MQSGIRHHPLPTPLSAVIVLQTLCKTIETNLRACRTQLLRWESSKLKNAMPNGRTTGMRCGKPAPRLHISSHPLPSNSDCERRTISIRMRKISGGTSGLAQSPQRPFGSKKLMSPAPKIPKPPDTPYPFLAISRWFLDQIGSKNHQKNCVGRESNPGLAETVISTSSSPSKAWIGGVWQRPILPLNHQRWSGLIGRHANEVQICKLLLSGAEGKASSAEKCEIWSWARG